MEDKKINNNFSLFGLPEKVVHCKKCLMHNQKPYSINESKHTIEKLKDNLKFDEEGVCEACRYSEKKKTIDYSGREKLLLKMLDKYRKDNGEYDCIVSGGGGKDSMSVSHMLKYKYGMHPLTITYSPLLYTDVGWRNMQNWINKGGFDNYLFTPNGKVASILAREALENFSTCSDKPSNLFFLCNSKLYKFFWLIFKVTLSNSFLNKKNFKDFKF
mgnify:CR=1 FL=1